jgi:hypothetical protein
MSLNYASVWQPGLLAIINQNCLTSPFITSNVKWLGAKTFHFTQMSVSGFKNHTRTKGFNAGTYSQNDNAYTIEHTRDIEFPVDRADVDETNGTASAQNVAAVFTQTRHAPEVDAYFFEKVAKKAQSVTGLYSETALSDYTVANVFTKIKAMLKKGKLRAYKQRGSLVVYVYSDIMDLLERSTELTKKVEVTQINDGGISIETRVTAIDTVPVIEVIDTDRFCDKFKYDGTDGGFEKVAQAYTAKTLTSGDSLVGLYSLSGTTYTKVTSGTYSNGTYYEKTIGSRTINILVACLETCITVPKINSIYWFEPGAAAQGDCYLYQERADWDTFVFPNGLTNTIDSIAVDVDTTEYTA